MTHLPLSYGPYTLLRRLGAGGMAETFEALRRGPGGFEQRVCLKRILPAFEGDAEFVRMFLREAKTSASLRHTNIVQVLDFGVVDGSHYLVLELVEGADLRAVLNDCDSEESHIPIEQATLLAIELSSALEYAHRADERGSEQGVIHRDVSPSNVLVSSAGEVKLTDFGIAKAVQATTRSGLIKGKVPYMAPEYATQGLFSAKSDLYALGVTLYEVLTGRRPYEEKSQLDLIQAASTGAFTPPHALRPDTPFPLSECVSKLLQPEPEDRFPSAAALLDALTALPLRPNVRRDLGKRVRAISEKREATLSTAQTEMLEESRPSLESERPVTRDLKSSNPRTKWFPPPENARPSVDPDAETRTVGAAAAQQPAKEPTVKRIDGQIKAQRKKQLAFFGFAFIGGAALSAGLLLLRPLIESAATRVPPEIQGPSDEREQTKTAGIGARPEKSQPEKSQPEKSQPSGPQGALRRARTAAAGSPPGNDTSASQTTSPETSEPTNESQDDEATLSIRVKPLGNVWINGQKLGPSPQRVRVRPGKHTVAGGDLAPTTQKTIIVSPGQTRRVILSDG